MTGEHGVGQIVTGEVLPLRAMPNEPDTLGPEFADTLHKVIDDPWPVLPPEQWGHRPVNAFRNPSFGESLQGLDPIAIRKMAVESLVAPVRARKRAGRFGKRTSNG